MEFEDLSLAALKEWWLARSIARRLLRSHTRVIAQQSALSGTALYRAVLEHSGLVESAAIEETLSLAEDSVDEWTAPQRPGLGLRELAHFLIMSEHRARGHAGSVVSFGAIVDRVIPGHL